MTDLLETAIAEAGGVGKLADALGIRQNVVSNWRARGLPRPWAVALELKFPQQNTPTVVDEMNVVTLASEIHDSKGFGKIIGDCK